MKNRIIKSNKADLVKKLNEKRLSLHDLRFGLTGSKNKNVKEQRTIRKDIARILTALKEMN